MQKMVKKINTFVSLMLISSIGCNFHEVSSPNSTVHGKGWKFKVPSNGWWFIQRGSRTETILVGSTYGNIGSRSMQVTFSQKCTSEHSDSAFGKEIGHGSKWMGNEVGSLRAVYDPNSDSIVYTAKASHDKCLWTLRCEGDSRRSKEIESICDSMVSSLEFIQ